MSHDPTGNSPRRRVLVIEDDSDTREFLRDLLTAAGFETDVAADADGARALAAALAPDGLVIDLSLPRESGTCLLRDLRSRGLRAPAVFVTAHPNPPAELGGERLVVIAKPFRPDELVEAIEAGLRGRAA